MEAVITFESRKADSAAIKGCNYIYAPAGQAGEYAPLAANPYRGCGHGCAYCYVPAVLRMPRPEFDAGAIERPGFIKALEKDAAKYRAAGITEQVMLSFTTDPYHAGETSLTRTTLMVLRDHGLGFCTLTKGGTRALRDIDLFRPDRDAFASTLTSLDNSFSLKWERNAALPADRLKALRMFYEAGIFTWVSLEPTLDVESSLRIVEETHEFVNLFKIGRVNYTAVKKQQAQLAELQERRDQLEMMMRWRAGLKDIVSDQVDIIANAWSESAKGWLLNEAGLKDAKSLLKKFGLKAVLDAMEIAADRYMRVGDDGNPTDGSIDIAWSKVGGICALEAMPDDERRLYYVKAILNKRLTRVPYDVLGDLKFALNNGVALDEMEREAKSSRNWSAFRNWLYS